MAVHAESEKMAEADTRLFGFGLKPLGLASGSRAPGVDEGAIISQDQTDG